MDLMLNTSLRDGVLVISDAHIMPTSGTFAGSQNGLGRSGLRQLARDIASEFGVTTIEITNPINRGSSGATGSFGPARISIVDGNVTVAPLPPPN